MRLVLDTNIFIFAFSDLSKPSCVELIEVIAFLYPKVSIHIPRTILRETRGHLNPSQFKEFVLFIHEMAQTDEDIIVPFDTGIKYEQMGLKPADAMIAAYTEWIQAAVLVSENRHFLSRQTNLPFKVLTADKTLKLLKR
ncbi:MAG: hypothetical protein HQL13_01170 [Candidatus Omnitrophica bacterium]|nr:hypothetical protein [Candidatus Omnitrophota bacterium]